MLGRGSGAPRFDLFSVFFLSFYLDLMLRLRSGLSWLDIPRAGQDAGPKPPKENDDDDDDDDNPTHRNHEEGEAKSQEGTVGQSVSQSVS